MSIKSAVLNIALTLLAGLGILLALELVLTAGGFPVYYPPDIRGMSIEVAPWWTCDAIRV